MTKQEAVREILVALSSPMYLMCKQNREDIFKLADEFSISARDLLELRLHGSQKAHGKE